MSAHIMRVRLGRLLITTLLAVGLWSSAAGAVAAADRVEATGDATPVPIPVTAAVVPTGLDAATPLPGGSVPWTAVAAPPARAAAGGLLLQGGGGTPQLRYYALDALGSVRVVFDAAGAVVSRADYEPFGAPIPASTTGTLPRQQYTGHERDGEVGLDYFGARMYLPQHGRMPSVDPLYTGAVESPQRWNRYAYALNSPTNVVDPDGRTARTCAGKSNGKVDACNDGGAKAGGAEPTLSIGHSEHSVDLFLWMQYGDWGYGTGGRGGAIDGNEWDYATQKPKAPQARLATSVVVQDEDGNEHTQELFSGASDAIVVASAGNPAVGAAAVAVYVARSAVTGQIIYVGITSRFAQRAIEHMGRFSIDKVMGLEKLTRPQARAVEQFVIEKLGLQKVGGQLENMINSISPTRANFHSAVEEGRRLWEAAGARW